MEMKKKKNISIQQKIFSQQRLPNGTNATRVGKKSRIVKANEARGNCVKGIFYFFSITR
jgi:hypothetical protein